MWKWRAMPNRWQLSHLASELASIYVIWRRFLLLLTHYSFRVRVFLLFVHRFWCRNQFDGGGGGGGDDECIRSEDDDAMLHIIYVIKSKRFRLGAIQRLLKLIAARPTAEWMRERVDITGRWTSISLLAVGSSLPSIVCKPMQMHKCTY